MRAYSLCVTKPMLNLQEGDSLSGYRAESISGRNPPVVAARTRFVDAVPWNHAFARSRVAAYITRTHRGIPTRNTPRVCSFPPPELSALRNEVGIAAIHPSQRSNTAYPATLRSGYDPLQIPAEKPAVRGRRPAGHAQVN